MSKNIVSCRSCEKEVSKNAKTCPHCGENCPGISKKVIKFNKIILSSFGVFFVFIITIVAFQSRNDKPQTIYNSDLYKNVVRTKLEDKVVEFRMAAIETGSRDPDSVTVQRFYYLLKNIAKRTNSTTDKTGEMTLAAHKELRENYGVYDSLLFFTEEANRMVIDNGRSDQDYQAVLDELIETLAN